MPPMLRITIASGQRDGQGRKRLVRNGYLTEREIQTGIGGIPVRIPRVETSVKLRQSQAELTDGITLSKASLAVWVRWIVLRTPT